MYLDNPWTLEKGFKGSRVSPSSGAICTIGTRERGTASPPPRKFATHYAYIKLLVIGLIVGMVNEFVSGLKFLFVGITICNVCVVLYLESVFFF